MKSELPLNKLAHERWNRWYQFSKEFKAPINKNISLGTLNRAGRKWTICLTSSGEVSILTPQSSVDKISLFEISSPAKIL